MTVPLSRRGGLTINPLVFLLLLVLIVLATWQGWQLLDIASNTPSRSAAYATGTKVGVVVGSAFGVLIASAIAGGVGAALYFIAGRSEFAANLGIGLVLLLACGAYGFSNYLIATRPDPATASATTNAQPPVSREQANAEALAAEARALRERMEQTRRLALQGGAPSPGASSSATSTGPSTPQETRPPPAPLVTDPEEERKAKAALDPLRQEVGTKIAEFLTEAAPVVESLGKPPKALRSELEARVNRAVALKAKADTLEGYLRTLDAKAESVLKDAGLDFGAQVRQKVAFSQSVDPFSKANACGVYKRLCDAGLEEAQALRDNAGRWRTDSAGRVTSSDRSLQFRLTSLHETVQLRLRGAPDADSALRKPLK